jgi:hypothetical protein
MANEVTYDKAVLGSISSVKKSLTILTPMMLLLSCRAMPLACPVQRSMRLVGNVSFP